MENKEALVIIANTFLIHRLIAFDVPSFIINSGYTTSLIIAVNLHLSIGVSLLLFPVFGLIADVYLTRYRMLQVSLLMLVFALIVALIF